MLTVIQYFHRYYALVPILLLIAAVVVLSSSSHSFAQQQQQGNLKTNAMLLKNSTGNSTGSSTPVLEKVSEKGFYRVRLSWPLVVSDAARGLQLQIDFLNASAPASTNATVPQRENNSGGSGIKTHFSDASILDSPLPVKSYDLIIYSADGKELWKKTGLPGIGGRGTHRIVLDNNYTGPATIEVTNIQPGWSSAGASATSTASTANNMVDSVKFTTTIVPEFPITIIMLPLAIGIAATLLVPRLKQRLM